MPRYALFGVQLDSEPALQTLVELPAEPAAGDARDGAGAGTEQVRSERAAGDARDGSSSGTKQARLEQPAREARDVASGREVHARSEPAGREVPLVQIRLDREAPAKARWEARYTLDFAETDEPFMTVYQRGGEHLLRVYGRADFRVSAGGDRIACSPQPDTPWATVEQLLIDQIIPRAMQLMGRPCLHASAVCGPSGVIALLGEAGSGKSTLSAALCERGYELICDDCLALDIRARPIRVLPGYPSVRLWPDSAEALLGAQHALPLASPRTDKLRKRYALDAGTPPLARIFCLTPDDSASPPRRQRLRAREGFAALTAALHRLTPRGAAILSAEFELLSAIAEQTPIERLSYRQDYAGLDALLDTVLAEPSTP